MQRMPLLPYSALVTSEYVKTRNTEMRPVWRQYRHLKAALQTDIAHKPWRGLQALVVERSP